MTSKDDKESQKDDGHVNGKSSIPYLSQTDATTLAVNSDQLHVHFDCFSGAAGDMMLAACIDLVENNKAAFASQESQQSRGFLDSIIHCLKKGLPEIANEFEISVEKVQRCTMSASYVTVHSVYDHQAAPVPGRGKKSDQTIYSESNHSHEHSHHHSHGHAHSHEHDNGHGHSHQTQSSYKEGGDGTTKESAGKRLETVANTDSSTSSSNDNHGGDQASHHDHSHANLRNLPQITKMLDQAPIEYISDWVKLKAIQAFTLLAHAEAAVHGASSIDTVHFHEVGAVDSIVDTVGTLIALDLLKKANTINTTEMTFSCSKLPLGQGSVWTDHGMLPVPAPATLYLLKDVPVTSGPPGRTGELVTPTAAALLKVLTTKCSSIGTNGNNSSNAIPDMTLRYVGIGAGTKDFDKHPNILRLLIGVVAK